MQHLLRVAALAAGVLLGQQALAQQVPDSYVDLDLSTYKLYGGRSLPVVLKVPAGTQVLNDDGVLRLSAPGYAMHVNGYVSSSTEAKEIWDADGGRAGVKKQLMLGDAPQTVVDEPNAYRYRSTQDLGEAGAVIVRKPGSKDFCLIYLDDKPGGGNFTQEEYDNAFASARSAHFKVGAAAAAKPAMKPAARPAAKPKGR